MLQPFLVLHSKPMLLVDDDDAEVLESNIGAEEPMSSDNNVGASICKLPDHDLLLLRGLEAAQRAYDYRKIREAIAKGSRMLLGQNCRRHEHSHLAARLNRLECGAHGDLCLSVTNVADEQPVHRSGALHVAFYVGGRRALVGGILEQK